MNTCPKCGLESGQYCSVCDDFGAVGKLRPRAFQRHQNRRKRSNIDPIQGHILDACSFNGILIQRVIEWLSTMISNIIMEGENGDQNMPMGGPYIAPFLTSLAPIDSPESQLSIGAKLVKNGEM